MATDPEMFARFKQQIDGLKVHRDPVEGPSLKKPLLLLLVISRMHRGLLRDNQVRFVDVEQELAGLIREFGWRTLGAGPSPEQPFERLASSPIWRLQVAGGVSRGLGKALPRAVLRDPSTHASLEEKTFSWLQGSADARAQASRVLLERWCPADRHDAIRARLGLP